MPTVRIVRSIRYAAATTAPRSNHIGRHSTGDYTGSYFRTCVCFVCECVFASAPPCTYCQTSFRSAVRREQIFRRIGPMCR